MTEPSIQILEVRNELSEVERSNNFLHELWVQHALPEDLEAPVAVCLEEVLSNVIRHGIFPEGDCEIKVGFRVLPDAAGGIEIEVSDNAGAFDPLSLPPPDLSAPLADRKAGGLGVLLVRKLMDEVHYERNNGRNQFFFKKHW